MRLLMPSRKWRSCIQSLATCCSDDVCQGKPTLVLMATLVLRYVALIFCGKVGVILHLNRSRMMILNGFVRYAPWNECGFHFVGP